MNESNSHDPWDDDELARTAGLPDFDDTVRDALLAGTTRVVRRRRHARIATQCAALALTFAAGMLAAKLLPAQAGRRAGDELPVVSDSAIGSDQERGVIAPLDLVGDALFDNPEELARAYEAADPAGRLLLLKGAGDHALNSRTDLREALSFYGQWLHEADASLRSDYDPSDTWLLASLKHTP